MKFEISLCGTRGRVGFIQGIVVGVNSRTPQVVHNPSCWVGESTLDNSVLGLFVVFNADWNLKFKTVL